MTPIEYIGRSMPILSLLLNKGVKPEHEAMLCLELCELNTVTARMFRKALEDGEVRPRGDEDAGGPEGAVQ